LESLSQPAGRGAEFRPSRPGHRAEWSEDGEERVMFHRGGISV
jgi:hypothetical protein